MARLIDADDIKCAFNDTNIAEYGLYPNNIVDTVPTAYDVDKVVEELNDYVMWKNFMIYELTSRERGIINKAIEIVKAGVK